MDPVGRRDRGLMKNCQTIICPVYGRTNPSGNCEGCGRMRRKEIRRNLLTVRRCYLANSVKEAVSSRKSLIDRRGKVEYTRG